MKLERVKPGKYELDLRDQMCPFTEVYTLRFAEKIHSGDRLDVLVSDNCGLEESVQALRMRGYEVHLRHSSSAEAVRLEIRRP